MEDPFIAMRAIRIFYEDGSVLETQINGTCAEVTEYYVGTYFQFGDTEDCPGDKMIKAMRVEFLS